MSDTPTPDDLAALVATLRADVAYMRSEDGAPCCVSAEDADDYERAADALGALAARIEELEAENKKLCAALEEAPHDFVSGCDADDGYHSCTCYKAAAEAVES